MIIFAGKIYYKAIIMDIGVIFYIVLACIILYVLLAIIWYGILMLLGILRIIWLVVSFPFKCIFYTGAFLFGLCHEILQYLSNRRQKTYRTENTYNRYEYKQEKASGSASGNNASDGWQRESYRPADTDKEEQYLQILELSRQTLNKENLKKNFRRLAKAYHPDKNSGNPVMEEKFKFLVEAYDYFSKKI